MKKTLALLLSAAILLPLFASCGDKPDATDSSAETTVQTEPAVTEDTPDVPDAAELQIGGDFNILVAGNWAWNDYESDGTDGTVVDSAIFRRNKYMLDTYGVDVKNEDIVEYSTAMGSGKGYMRLYTGYMSGTNAIDAAMIGTSDVATLAYSSVLEDLHEVPYIDLSKDYWDQKANEDLTIGDGKGKPKGIIEWATASDATPAASAIKLDDLIDLIRSVDSAYARNGRFMFNRNTLYSLVKIKDTTNRYIWQEGAKDGTPPTLFAKPYTLNDDMPDIAAGKASVLFGDFSKFKIRMVKDFRVIRLNELLAEYLSIGIFGFARLDGLLLNAGTHPIKKLVHAASGA